MPLTIQISPESLMFRKLRSSTDTILLLHPQWQPNQKQVSEVSRQTDTVVIDFLVISY